MKKIILLFLVLCSFCLVGCGHIEDTNGPDDYSLCELSFDNIINGISSSTEMVSSNIQIGNKCTVKVKKFSGVKKIDEFRLNSDNFSINLSCEVASGNLMVVLVKDDKLIKEFVVNKDNQSFTINNGDGKYYLYVLGESAQYKIVYEYNY